MKREKGTADFRRSFCIYASKTISRVLYLTVIYLDAPLPVRSSHPGSGRASLGARSSRSHTGVAPDRVYSDGLFPAIECALTALFHPYRQGYALAVSRFLTESVAAADDCNREEGPFVPLHTTPLRFPLGERSSTPASYQHGAALAAVYLCCTFPEVAFGGRYPLSLPCGARTFLTWALFSADARLSVPVVFILLYFGGNVKRIAKFIPSGYNMGVVQRLRRAAQGKEGHRS